MLNGAETTYFVGAHYEVTDGVVTKYYYAGAQRIAMRKDGTLNYLLGDHLGSTSLSTDAAGNVVSEMKYKAWGEVRHASGTTPTKCQYTGQYSYASDFGLLFYNARWYDPSLGRFNQPDTIIPEQSQGVQAWDRYAYTNNNPVKYTDSTGHLIDPITAVLILLGSFFILNSTSDSYQPNLSAEELAPRRTSAVMGLASWLLAASIKFPIVEAAADTYDCATGGMCGLSLMVPGPGSLYTSSADDVVAVPNPHLTADSADDLTDIINRTDPLPDDALVCRGGTCQADRFAAGAENIEPDGTLTGVSVNSAPGASLDELTVTIPNNQVGVTTVGDIRLAGGNVKPWPLSDNPFHALLSGLLPSIAEKLFTPTIQNPNRVKGLK